MTITFMVFYWSHRPVLAWYGRALQKSMDIRRWRSLETIIETGYYRVLLNLYINFERMSIQMVLSDVTKTIVCLFSFYFVFLNNSILFLVYSSKTFFVRFISKYLTFNASLNCFIFKFHFLCVCCCCEKWLSMLIFYLAKLLNFLISSKLFLNTMLDILSIQLCPLLMITLWYLLFWSLILLLFSPYYMGWDFQ